MMPQSAGLKAGVIAGALGLVAMGAGHLYLGRIRRFMIPAAVFVCYVTISSVLGFLSNAYGYMLLVAFMFALLAFAILDSIVVGIRSGRESSSWYARWRYVLLWFTALLLVAFRGRACANTYWVSQPTACLRPR